MNIFILDKNPKICAKFYCDAHIKVYGLRLSQSLSNAHWYSFIKEESPEEGFSRLKEASTYFYEKYPVGHEKRPPYKVNSAMLRHPSTIWLTENKNNYLWCVELLHHVCNEYYLLRGKEHKARGFIKWFHNNVPNSCNITDKRDKLIFEQVVPEEYKNYDVIEGYRQYYKNEKVDIASWDRSKKPEWF
tara:strand:+ start:62 stop:625 length:564 start_codon:yes stop_codon:yes gene_type:complete